MIQNNKIFDLTNNNDPDLNNPSRKKPKLNLLDLTKISKSKPSINYNRNQIIDVEKFKNKVCLKKVCETGDLRQVHKMVSDGYKPDEACVFYAVKSNHFDILEYLLVEQNTPFSVNVFLYVSDPKILILLLENQDKINAPKDKVSETLYKNIKKYQKFIDGGNSDHSHEKGSSEGLIKHCEAENIQSVKEYLKKGGNVTLNSILLAISRKNRVLFGLLIKNPEKLINSDPKKKNYRAVIDATILPLLISLGWIEEAEYFLKNGMTFTYKQIDCENEHLMDLLSLHPELLEYPFTAIYSWFEGKKCNNFIKFMDESIFIKQKIMQLFKWKPEKQTLVNKNFISAFTSAMNVFFKLEKSVII